MKFKILNTTIAVLILATAIYTIVVFIPNSREDLVNSEVYAVVDSNIPSQEEKVNPLSALLPFEKDQTYLLTFYLLNRDVPTKWQGKDIYLKYTSLGEYTEDMVAQLNDLLKGDYKWQRQLDEDRNIILGGPLFLKDDIYQLHTHNGLSFGVRHYLFGDLLHLLYSKEELEGTKIMLGDVVLEAVWSKDTRVLEDNTTPAGADLIISTCLERDGDRRLISGWKLTQPGGSQ